MDDGAMRSIDWEAIERSPDFQELTSSRRRFAWLWGSVGIGIGALYVVLAGVAPSLMGTKVIGDMSIGFAGGVGLIVLTLAITWAYMRRSDRVWGPLEERVRAQIGTPAEGEAGDRFTRAAERASARAPR